MATLMVKCDGCGFIGTGKEVYEGENHTDVCASCRAKERLHDLDQKLIRTRKDLASCQVRVKELEELIEEVKKETKGQSVDTKASAG